MAPATTSSGIKSNGNDVKLTVLAGGLGVGVVGETDDDIVLGAGDLTLNVTGAVTQTSQNTISASGLQLLGSGTVNLDDSGNNVTTLAANYTGTISYTDANALIVGTVTSEERRAGKQSSGIKSNGNDVKLTVLAGGLTIGAVGETDDYIVLDAGDHTLNVSRQFTHISQNVISASGLQLLGSGTVNLDDSGNNVTTLAANYTGTISYTDANALIVGTV